MGTVYSKDSLHDYSEQRSYGIGDSEFAFLLGGIGTGNVSVGVRGQLRDWEIFGRPGKGNYLPYTFFALRAAEEGCEPVLRVLEGRIQPPLTKPLGHFTHDVSGLPRFTDVRTTAEYPFVEVALYDDEVPLDVTMMAYTPFIPLHADDSSIPAAILAYRVRNTSARPVDVSVVGSMANVSTHKGYQLTQWKHPMYDGETVNEYVEDDELRGLLFRPAQPDPDNLHHGTLALTTTDKGNDGVTVSHKRSWLRGGWWDGYQDMWNDFKDDGKLEPESQYIQVDGINARMTPDRNGSLAIQKTLQPGEEYTFQFIISWCFPNRVGCWSCEMYDDWVRPHLAPEDAPAAGTYPTVKQYYATLYPDAWAAAHYTAVNLERLHRLSQAFRTAFFGSTLPRYVLEAVADTITVMRSTTCIRIADGTFMAWEGCFADEGSCEGTCTHVWNYAQSIAFLFPELERVMRRVEYLQETEPDGKMNFRAFRFWNMPPHDHVPAADGQMGTLVRLYREWMFSGDDDFLRELWPNAQKTLEFALTYWDVDGDGVLDSGLFNTYDIAFEGPSSMINSLFFAALLAAANMAEHLGDAESAARYRAVAKSGAEKMDAMLWGGEYYIQQCADPNQYRYQYGSGCLSDQIFGQTLAHITGLGYVLPKAHVQETARSIFRHNFLNSAAHHECMQRTYLFNEEAGLVLCTWPQGGRPALPFPYSDEVWTGIEYQVATNLIWEGLVDEGLTIVRAVRDRHDGVRRNPFNEVEHGNHYARSLASYGVLTALCGYRFDLPHGTIGFAPRVQADDFRCFFSTDTGWGVYSRTVDASGEVRERIDVLYGQLEGVALQ